MGVLNVRVNASFSSSSCILIIFILPGQFSFPLHHLLVSGHLCTNTSTQGGLWEMMRFSAGAKRSTPNSYSHSFFFFVSFQQHSFTADQGPEELEKLNVLNPNDMWFGPLEAAVTLKQRWSLFSCLCTNSMIFSVFLLTLQGCILTVTFCFVASGQ